MSLSKYRKEFLSSHAVARWRTEGESLNTPLFMNNQKEETSVCLSSELLPIGLLDLD